MAKSFYIGVDSIARKAKKAYIGIDGVARKIKKMYIGVAGVARLFFSGSGQIEYYGTATSLTTATDAVGSASNENYAIFPCANFVADVYDASLTKTSVQTTRANSATAGTSFGDYLILYGNYYNSYDVYDSSLTRTNVNSLSNVRTSSGAGTNETYAMFAGGYLNNNPSSVIECIDSSLTVTMNDDVCLSTTATFLNNECANSKKYVAFDVVDSYNMFDTSLTRTVIESDSRLYKAGTSIGDYILFAGGYNGYASPVTGDGVVAFDGNLTKHTLPSLSQARFKLGATSVGDNAIFAGGHTYSDVSSVVDVYDSSLVLTKTLSLSAGRQYVMAESVGDYALIAGGSSSEKVATVDAFLCNYDN